MPASLRARRLIHRTLTRWRRNRPVKHSGPVAPANSAGITLKVAYKKLLDDKDIEAFEQQCGDHFVISIANGGKLSILASVQTSRTDDASTMAAGFQASGFGGNVNGNFKEAHLITSNKKAKRMCNSNRRVGLALRCRLMEQVMKSKRRLTRSITNKDFRDADMRFTYFRIRSLNRQRKVLPRICISPTT